MSQENVDLCRRATEAFIRGDLEAWLTEFDPEVVWYAWPDEPEPGPFRGHKEVLKMVDRWRELSSDLRVEVEEYIDAGEYVLVPARNSVRIEGPGTDVVVGEVYLNKCRNGKIIEVRECRTRVEAFEAAGVSAQAARSEPA
jgi:ketosteroid isomerase-like protein